MKRKLLSYLIAIGVGAVLMVAILGILGVYTEAMNSRDTLSCVSDGFFVAGVVLFTVGVFLVGGDKGMFDAASYRFSLWTQRYTQNRRNWRPQETYIQYRDRKAEKRKARGGFGFLLWVGFGYILVGAIILVARVLAF